jgi:hypothetical protein
MRVSRYSCGYKQQDQIKASLLALQMPGYLPHYPKKDLVPLYFKKDVSTRFVQSPQDSYTSVREAARSWNTGENLTKRC